MWLALFLKNLFGSRKGYNRLVFIVAMMTLGILFVALWITSVDNWLSDLGDQFINNIV